MFKIPEMKNTYPVSENDSDDANIHTNTKNKDHTEKTKPEGIMSEIVVLMATSSTELPSPHVYKDHTSNLYQLTDQLPCE